MNLQKPMLNLLKSMAGIKDTYHDYEIFQTAEE